MLQDGRDEILLSDQDTIKTPAEVRQLLSLYALERTSDDLSPEATRAALALARAAVRPNFSYNQLITEERRRDKRAQASEVVVQVQRGTAVVREGDVVTREQAEMLAALAGSREGYGMAGVFFAMVAFCGMIFVSLFSFGAGFIRRFSTRPQDIEALSFLALLTLFFSRLVVEVSGPLAAGLGLGMAPSALWYAVPLAGGAMLARILINAETALLWILGVSAVTGLLMEQDVLFSMFFAISGLTAAASIEHTRERSSVLLAGVQTGLIGASAALLISLIQVYLGDSPAQATSVQPLWDVSFAFLGGIMSAFLVLGLVPIFEMCGFVTDFKLLELANLNHPLLRQLMLRAPGTYHHSMTVASLSEAAAESIGANALQTRVACYFHDIGKALQPQFFIENQRGGPNPHDRLQPRQSARVIVNHVVDGAAIAEQHNLPQCVLDGILMHHGTSIIKYFYVMAHEQAEEGEVVDEADFRYPGKRPDSRESGIIFLADRVEAACRTIKVPTAHNFRKMIQKLVNDAITDGQLEECPLTVKELYTVVEVFTTTLQGIHHHRIEYPLLPPKVRASGRPQAPEDTASIITLEMPNPLTPRSDANQDS
jgi:putative nucleotidyltransferase with HDIG domain